MSVVSDETTQVGTYGIRKMACSCGVREQITGPASYLDKLGVQFTTRHAAHGNVHVAPVIERPDAGPKPKAKPKQLPLL